MGQDKVMVREAGLLPPDDPLRHELHNELHARPTPRIRLPALVVQVAVRHEGFSREEEYEHLRRLSGLGELELDQLAGIYLRLHLPGGSLRWERHTEFSTYTLIQPLPALEASPEADLLGHLIVDASWLRSIPGRTLSAVKLIMLHGAVEEALTLACPWLGVHSVVASLMGRNGHSCAVTDFLLRPDGFEQMVVVAPPGTSETRAGRIAARLLEMEAYRMMALLGYPLARALRPMLLESERALAGMTARIRDTNQADAGLLDELEALAARVEHAMAEHSYRFSASAAYHALVKARLAELREAPIPGIQTIGEFLQRRFSPAMATVESTAQRLAALSQRIERAGALLRTRVDIALETQNQELLHKLKRGQEMQYQLQRTVEGLSIAAISYYVVGLLYYLFKAGKEAGLPISPELAAGLSIPGVMAAVWWLTRQIHHRLASQQNRVD
ncbi:DUF3422 family protein [Meiothermus taiwanensis]|jgi:uncharacterized membrane-anchored protein|uniref:DUF3422 domain-containing protein n=2 Tax=Meiothermus taiwanensis TaxID=172827 RepID=A0A399E822_9DEIN|nr:DUF3422 domain-containing protein [Meiothermus taiwanensis]AWR85468.1 hypothetical protein Mtai_v1c02170 [Meiothermus taiwanensis WR-220]KIQ55630.1 hypothetical protein SY28_02215 [Meiothermus taiwanensis]KZK16454.1 hypothetical protein A3962_00560 [Meiothermus taiwanensis]RIH80068.1 hypothetical protein Mcate_00039 [Meiothermus taiwanensis]